jgi:hypothetical protein
VLFLWEIDSVLLQVSDHLLTISGFRTPISPKVRDWQLRHRMVQGL